MAKVKRRIVDKGILKLIRQWLENPVVEEDDQGRKKYEKPKSGTPQGGVLSPLLANIYLHEMDKAFYEEEEGPYQIANARLVSSCCGKLKFEIASSLSLLAMTENACISSLRATRGSAAISEIEK